MNTALFGGARSGRSFRRGMGAFTLIALSGVCVLPVRADTQTGTNGNTGSNGTGAAPAAANPPAMGAATPGQTVQGTGAVAQGTGGDGGTGGNGATPTANPGVGGQSGRGGDGASGGDGNASSTNAGAAASAQGFGGRGGNGGKGGLGWSNANGTVTRFGGNGARGGDGGNSTAVASGRSADAEANGGRGGDGGTPGAGGGPGTAGGHGGRGGDGGVASASATSNGNKGANQTLQGVARSTGGRGGNSGMQLPGNNGGTTGLRPGDGGNASATGITNNTGAGEADTYVDVMGGDAGVRPGGLVATMGVGGTAMATAETTSAGKAFAYPTAVGGKGVNGKAGKAKATGMSTGSNGKIISSAMTPGQRTLAALATNVDVSGATASESQSFENQAIPGRANLLAFQAAAYGAADPITTQVNEFRAAAPNAGSALYLGEHNNTFGLAALGGVRAASAGPTLLQESSASFTVDTTQLTTLDGLAVAFAAPREINNGFDSLLLTITATGMAPIVEPFGSPSQALAELNDGIRFLPDAAPDSTGMLNVTVDLQMYSHNAGDGFLVDMVVSSIPAPGTAALALVGIGLASRRRRARV